jgi:hypothetical protein
MALCGAVGQPLVRALFRWGGGRTPTLAERRKLRLNPDVLDAFRADGPGWQGRINAALRKAVGCEVAYLNLFTPIIRFRPHLTHQIDVFQ